LPVDPNFENVTMLLHGDGTNGAQNNTFLDSSTNNFTITRNGNTTQGSFSPYGPNWSNFFDNTNNLRVTNNAVLDFGTGDFTVEFWAFRTIEENTSGVYSMAADRAFLIGGSGAAYVYNGGVNTGGTAANNTWNHYAFVRQSGTIRAYINGTQVMSFADSNSYTPAYDPYIASTQFSERFPGYLSNLRVVKGTAVYTSSFTPSTTPLTAISGTSLLTCQSNRFTDSSVNNLALTFSGTPSVQRFSPFQPTAAYNPATIGGSGYFDGAGDYLSISGSAATAMGTGDFTWEVWVYIAAVAGYQDFIDSRIGGNASTDGFSLALDTGTLTPTVFTTGVVLSSAINVTQNAWTHVALTRASGTLRFWINGVSAGSVGNSTNLSNQSVSFGASAAGFPVNGYLSNIRMVKGTAVYTAAFTPPTAPVTAITNTSILLNYTNAAIFDNAMMNNLETVGNAQISTSVVKFGTGSISFDGANPWDYLISPVSPNLGFGTGNFTIEGWGYVTSNGSTYQCLVSIGAPVQIYARSATIEVYFNDTDDASTYIVNGMTGPASSVSANTWFHFAVVRNGITFTAYVNGVAGTPVTGVSAQVALSATPFALGTYGPEPTTYPLTGYIDDFRITKGVARYTANFTPPTAAFPDQ
jgi:hypothetical protein